MCALRCAPVRHEGTGSAAASLILPLCFRASVAVFVATLLSLSLLAQSVSPPLTPYATLDRTAVTYRGPGRSFEEDLPPNVATIGMIVPLHGSRESEGKALLAAAQLAIEEEQAAGTLPDGRRLALAVRDDSGPWGQASTEILRLIEEDHALAIITSASGNIAHQAEQIANKISFPILTLSSDPTTTQVNIPWIFRLGPSDADQALAFTRDIYTRQDFRRVLLLVEKDRDGRIGSNEFEKAARTLAAPIPEQIEIDPASLQLEILIAQIKSKNPQAVVFWTSSQLEAQLFSLARQAAPSAAIYLCRKASQLGPEGRVDARDGEDAWIVKTRPGSSDTTRRTFEQRYLSRTGVVPGLAAAQAYDAVHILAAALRSVGTNRVLLRDRMASGTAFNGVAGIFSFDAAGNLSGDGLIVKLSPVNESNVAH